MMKKTRLSMSLIIFILLLGFAATNAAMSLFIPTSANASFPASNANFDFYELFENHSSVILVIDAWSGSILRANDAAVRYYGYPTEQLLSMRIQEISMLTPEQMQRELQAAVWQDKNRFMFPHRKANGDIRSVEASSFPYNQESRNLLYFIIEDVTEKDNKHQLNQIIERLNKAEHLTRLGHWEFHISDNKIIASEGAQTIYGLDSNEWPITIIQKMPLDEYRELLDNALFGLVHEDKPYDVKFKIKRYNDGILVDIHSIAEYDAENNVVFGVIQDISSQVAAAHKLRQQRNTIITSMILFHLLLVFIIILLTMNIRKRKLAEKKVAEQLVLEKLVTQVSTRFVNANSANIDRKIDRMLRKAGKALEVDRTYIFQYSQDKRTMTNTHEWCAEWIPSEKDNCRDMPIDSMPWWSEQIMNKKYVFIPAVDQMPPDALAEQKIFMPQGIQSMLCIPIVIHNSVLGHFGFDLVRSKRTWSQEQIDLMSLLANTLSEALESIEMEKRLKNEKDRLSITLSSVGDGVISTDEQGRVDQINGVAQQLTGWTEEEALGSPFEQVFHIIHETTREPLDNLVQRVLETGKTTELDKHTLLISKDGMERPVADSAAPIKDKNGNILGVVVVFRDVLNEKIQQQEVEYLSFHDQLTGLYNRRFFEAELSRLDTNRNLPLAIIMADVNGLKLTNDAFGHAKGDKLLKKAAQVLKTQCRSCDIIARLSGDEFVILLPETTQEEVELIISRITDHIDQVEECSIVLSMSMGWGIKHHEEEDMQDVCKKAEDSMYRRKLFESQSMRGKTLNTIINTLHKKNMREEQHSQRVSEYCAEIGRALQFNEEKIRELRSMGLLHDIGKIAIDDAILNKPDVLTEKEWQEMQRHSEIGYHILSAVNDMADMAEYVLAQHERWDGQGYPKQLKGEDIPLQARIMAVADAYDAMISDRTYKQTLTEQEALEELRRNAGSQFDPEIVEIFIREVLKK